MKKNVCFTIMLALTLAVALPVLASVPPPPVNQNIGLPDTVFNGFTEADCRLCHEDPDIVEPGSIPDRHHLLYGTAIPAGAASLTPGNCSGPGPETCYVNYDCPAGESCSAGQVPDPDSNQDGVLDTTFACLNCHREDTTGGIITMMVWRDCLACHNKSPHHQTTTAQSGNCSACHGTLVDNPTGCKELQCAVASSSAGTMRGVPLGIPCSPQGTTGTSCDTAGVGGGPVKVCRDTTVLCSTNADCVGIGAGTCSSAAYCGMYGGEDTCDDGHAIPTYAPSLVTPARSGHIHVCQGSGTCSTTTTTACSVDGDCPATETCVGADSCQYDTDCTAGTCSVTTTQTCHVGTDCPSGETCIGGVECIQEHEDGLVGGCTYCHYADPNLGTVEPASGVLVWDNHDTHHGAGIQSGPLGNSTRCAWCHMAGYPHSVYGEEPLHIRWCENCHGYESLHNIQVDSDLSPTGTIVVGGENAGWGHIGNNDDCWGCHGFATAAAPGSGPLTPFLAGSDALRATSGYETTLMLVGTTLTNLVGTYQWTSDITMTGADGSAVTLTPDSVSSSQMTVTIPAATAPGNYALRAVKGTYAASNPIVISVKPEVAITDSSCNRKKGVLSVSGSGFGEKPAGSDAYINVQVNGQPVGVTSWSDTQITASVSSCPANASVTVNAVMGSATSGSGGGKPPKPCNGKKCN